MKKTHRDLWADRHSGRQQTNQQNLGAHSQHSTDAFQIIYPASSIRKQHLACQLCSGLYLIHSNTSTPKHQRTSQELPMRRLTITLNEPRYRALKAAAVARNQTIGQLIDESLEFYGIKSREQAADLVRRARQASTLDNDSAMELALATQQATRQQL
jgi:predicted DNA-binding ribbon-helix-helix protein